MATYVALLHSIVLGPGRRVVMADLRAMAQEAGFTDARTLVSTGNLVFAAEDAPVCVIEERLEAAFRARFGKHVDIIVRTAGDWRRLAADNPFAEGEGGNVVVRVMRKPLAETALVPLARVAEPQLRLTLVAGDLWIDFAGKPSETKLLSHLTTKKLGIGTTRNANTVNGLSAMLG